MRHKLETQLKAEQELADLCQKAGTQVAIAYGQRGTHYDVLAEIESILEEK